MRLHREDVERDADVTGLDGPLECREVDDFAARGVDEVRTGLQRVEHGRTHEARGLRRQREMDAQHVGALGGFLRRPDGRFIGMGASSIRSWPVTKTPAPDDDRHSERVRALRHLLADGAVAVLPERPPVEAARLRELFLVPHARAQFGDVVGDPPVEREHQRARQLGHRNRVLARARRHVDAARRRRRQIDRVIARARANDERQHARLEHRGVDARPADDQDVGGGVAHGLGQRVAAGVGLIDDVAAGGLQAVDAALFKFVGD